MLTFVAETEGNNFPILGYSPGCNAGVKSSRVVQKETFFQRAPGNPPGDGLTCTSPNRDSSVLTENAGETHR